MSFSLQHFDTLGPDTVICWFRRDLRLQDNAALYYALKENKNVLPLFIFDTVILYALEDKKDRRVEFIHQSILILKTQLEEPGSSLLIFCGNPIDFFKNVRPKSVYTNHDYEPYAKKRDEEVEKILNGRDIPFKTSKDQVIFEKDEVIKQDGMPYTVFTPYSKSWKAKLNAFYLSSYATEKYYKNLKQTNALPCPTLSKIGFQSAGIPFPNES